MCRGFVVVFAWFCCGSVVVGFYGGELWEWWCFDWVLSWYFKGVDNFVGCRKVFCGVARKKQFLTIKSENKNNA